MAVEKIYEIDWDLVITFDDLKRILRVLDFRFSESATNLNLISDLTKEVVV